MGQAFVSDPNAISTQLVTVVARKACQIKTTFVDAEGFDGDSYGSGGLLRGKEIVGTPEPENPPAKATTPPRPKKKVKLENYSSYEVTPVTAKHNLALEEEGDEYDGTRIEFPGFPPMKIHMPDGGCMMTEHILVRPATEGIRAIHTEDNDYSFGETVATPERALTKMPFLFQLAPPTFRLQVGHNIGMTVYRTYEISHGDADANKSIDLTMIYGSPGQACIYTGTVTEISANGKTFGHNINTFEGCSGALVFLLDRNQPNNVDETLHGLVVGIHTGGVDDNTNLAFFLPNQEI